MLTMDIRKLRARAKLDRMDVAVYGNRIHASPKDQHSFDVMRMRVHYEAYPKE